MAGWVWPAYWPVMDCQSELTARSWASRGRFLGSAPEQCSAQGFIEGLMPVSQERTEKVALGRGQYAVLGQRLEERQLHERSEIAVVGEGVRRSGKAQGGR